MTYTVWMHDAQGEDSYVLGGVNHTTASALVRNLTGVVPGGRVWMEED
ncbi:hypothetical protein PBI_SHEAKEIRA_87 [Mycobacterium phage SheaKeira]|nr:hypothetical protein PBI_SHEAKEIRA_87 [Mycobacterium phage SheaKeira]